MTGLWRGPSGSCTTPPQTMSCLLQQQLLLLQLQLLQRQRLPAQQEEEGEEGLAEASLLLPLHQSQLW